VPELSVLIVAPRNLDLHESATYVALSLLDHRAGQINQAIQ
jgi:hypothetical protein